LRPLKTQLAANWRSGAASNPESLLMFGRRLGRLLAASTLTVALAMAPAFAGDAGGASATPSSSTNLSDGTAASTSPAPAAAEPIISYGTQTHQFTQWNAISLGSGNVFGFAHDRRLYESGLAYGFAFFHTRRISLRYSLEVIPVAYLSEPYLNGSPTLGRVSTERREIYGGGVSPVGFQLNLRRGRRLQPMADFHAGFLYFSRRILSDQASQFNFTVALGLGAQLFTTGRGAISAGVRYHHLSNANITSRNPGTDSYQLWVGYSVLR
jgi:hypothetical protein